jgi:hypothetical protein
VIRLAERRQQAGRQPPEEQPPDEIDVPGAASSRAYRPRPVRVIAGTLVMGTTPSRSRVQMRLTMAAIKMNSCHMILVICGPE